MSDLLDLLEVLAQKGICFERDAELSKKSSFKIGGICNLAVYPKNESELVFAIDLAHKNRIKHSIVGNGTNILFSDDGYNGILIFTHDVNKVLVEERRISAECGASLIGISNLARKNALEGFEFACGIPGTCGGAVFMNAGAYGFDISGVLVSSRCYDKKSGEVRTLTLEEHAFGNRRSIYSDDDNLVVLSAIFELKDGCAKDINARVEENRAKRRATQPLDMANIGSIFKRGADYISAKLIDDAGLKGYRIGGAEVSTKHAGFIVNRGDATSADVLALIKHIKSIVKEKYNVSLECEIRYIN